MKLVKSRGKWTPQGSRKAQALDAVKAPYLRARAADGSEVRKSGHFLTTFGKVPNPDQQLDGLYSVGLGILAKSTSGRGKFAQLPAPAGSAFGFFGAGLAQVSQVTFLGDASSFDGRPVAVYNIVTSTTDGSSPPEERFARTSAVLSEGSSSLGALTGERVAQIGGEPTPQNLIERLKVVGGQLIPSITVLTRSGATSADLPCPTNQLNGVPELAFFGPQHVVATCPSFTPSYSGSIVNLAATPGALFFASADAGRTWAVQDLTPVFGPELASLKSVLIPAASGGIVPLWNSAIRRILLRGFNPAPNLWMFLAVVPYVVTVGAGVQGRVKVGVRDQNTGAFTVSHTLFDGPIDRALDFATGGAIEWTHDDEPGLLLFTRPGVSTADRQDQPRDVVWVTPTSVTSLGSMPFASKFTGGVTALSRTVLTCPMYDGQYSMFVSNDGVQWRRRAEIFAGGAAPGSALQLTNFTLLTALRLRGRKASLTPQAPWASDYRKGGL